MKRTIIITDPCYIDSTFADDDWDIPGIDLLVNRDTIFGDWYCMCYRGDVDYQNLSEEWDAISDDWNEDEYETKKKEWLKKYCYGEFSADSGYVCVAFLDDVLKEYPEFGEFMKNHPWCVTVIPNFEGTVEEENVNGDYLRLIGKDKDGKVLFWTEPY